MYANVVVQGLLLTSPLFVRASPFSSVEGVPHLFKRYTPCEPRGTPEINKDYYEDLCPPVNRLLPDGTCPVDKGNYVDGCNSYCEIKQRFSYDEEKPVLDNPYCYGPMTCTVSNSKAFTYTKQVQINLAWTKAFTLGITGSYSEAEMITQLQSSAVTLKENECGYFTFVPRLHESCGSVTEGIWANQKCNTFPGSTYGNICTTQPARSLDGKEVIGATVFVRTDCSNNRRRPMEEQNPVYRNPGVAQPQSTYDAFIATFAQCTGAGCDVLDPVPNCTDINNCPDT